MARQRTCLVLVAWAIGMSLNCSGCEKQERGKSTGAPTRGEAEIRRLDVSTEQEPLRLDPRLMELGGEVDFDNLYPSAVMVSASVNKGEVLRCSGAAVSRHVVLTAGHCVCQRRKEEPSGTGGLAVVDSSACLEAVQVETVFYKPPVEQGTRSSGSTGNIYPGRAQPHPALRVTLDERGHVSSSQADLALIVLSKPLNFPEIELSDAEVETGDSVIVVGHEYDEVADVFGGERRFSLNKVIRRTAVDDGRFLIEQPQGHLYRQDSGGPCLRSESMEPRLVGVSARWLGEGAACTSIQGYQGWLRENIRLAESRGDSIKQ